MLTTVLKCTHFFLLICGVFWDFCLPVNAQDGHLVKSCTKLKNSCKNASPPPPPENTTLSKRKSKLYHHIRSTFAGSKSITERNTDFLFRFPKNGYGGGNGNPLQYSCLESPRGGGAWWAAVYGVAQNWTRLKRLSSSSSSSREYRRRQGHPTPVLLPGKSHGQRSLMGCSPWGR